MARAGGLDRAGSTAYVSSTEKDEAKLISGTLKETRVLYNGTKEISGERTPAQHSELESLDIGTTRRVSTRTLCCMLALRLGPGRLKLTFRAAEIQLR